MNHYVTNLKNVGKEDINTVGGKGANLGELLQLGMQVPEGFVVTVETYRAFIMENRINCESTAESVQKQIRAGKFSDQIRAEIVAKYNSMGANRKVAVRSSATAEDLPEASFAGQQETYLNVVGGVELLKKIKECYASLYSQRAVAYRKRNGFDHADVALAVVIQEMVESERAGVLFTANPMTGNNEEMLINASFGLGESVVSGTVTPDSFLVDLTGTIKKKVLGTKETQIIYSETGTKTITTKKEQRESFSLTVNQIQELVQQGKIIKEHFQMPMDIEWGILGINVYILQARAITTLSGQNEALTMPSKDSSLSRTQKKIVNGLIEHWPRACYPLDFEVGMILQDVKDVLFQELGITMGTIVWMDQMGYSHIPKFHVRPNLHIFSIFSNLKKYADNDTNLKKGEYTIAKARKSLEEIEELVTRNAEKGSLFGTADTMGLMKKLIEVQKQISYARFRYYIFPGVLLGRKLQRYLNKAGNISEYDLLSELDYKTLTINRQMQQIAEWIIKDKALLGAMQNGKEYVWLQQNFTKQWKTVDAFLEQNGWKSDLCCYPYSSVSWNENKDHFLVILNCVIKSELSKEGERSAIQEGKYEQIKKLLLNQVPEKKKQKVEKDIAFYRSCMVGREETQYLWETVFALLRKLLEHLEFLWKDEIKEKGDLRFLFQDELWEACKRGYLSKEEKQNLEERKRERRRAEQAWNRLGLEALSKTGDDLLGESGSAGSVRGRVCLVKDSQDFHKLEKGDILVCHFTDPEWTPLFALASGVVADTGGALSHAAIVAREYKIPAVLGVGRGTLELKDGDIVFVNGDKGVVKKISRAGEV